MTPKVLQAYNLFQCTRITVDEREKFVWELQNKLEVHPALGSFFFLALTRYISWYDYPNLVPEALDWLIFGHPQAQALEAWWVNHFDSQLNLASREMPFRVMEQMARYRLRDICASAEWELLRRQLSRSAILDTYQYCEIHCKWFLHGRPCTEFEMLPTCAGLLKDEFEAVD
ncbi:hypothetical protein RBB50_011521 [Rhinocladiella similis]